MPPASPSAAPPAPVSRHPRLVATAIVVGVVLVMAALQTWQYGRGSAERMLTEMAQPLGLLWLGLGYLVLVALFRHPERSVVSGNGAAGAGARGIEPSGVEKPRARRVWPLLILWLAVTAMGNRSVAEAALARTEYRPADDPVYDSSDALDWVVVLGGGVPADLEGRPMLGEDGDRVRPVLQLWHAGRTKRLVVTGTATEPGRPGPAEVTERLLESLGVPSEEILRVEGANTSEEMRHLRQAVDHWASEHGRPPKVGLVTSAFHLPRALRLARAEGLQVIPIPAARRGLSSGPIGVARMIVPTAEALEDLSRCWKEWLAALAGR